MKKRKRTWTLCLSSEIWQQLDGLGTQIRDLCVGMNRHNIEDAIRIGDLCLAGRELCGHGDVKEWLQRVQTMCSRSHSTLYSWLQLAEAAKIPEFGKSLSESNWKLSLACREASAYLRKKNKPTADESTANEPTKSAGGAGGTTAEPGADAGATGESQPAAEPAEPAQPTQPVQPADKFTLSTKLSGDLGGIVSEFNDASFVTARTITGYRGRERNELRGLCEWVLAVLDEDDEESSITNAATRSVA
ncbi:MAG: hypothetical protein NTW87_11525 [Planctomycetota bacterium]|nr:hypothetical protein [Planctomycetota bacterium]